MLEFSINGHPLVDSKFNFSQCQGTCFLEDNRSEMTWVNLQDRDMGPTQSTH